MRSEWEIIVPDWPAPARVRSAFTLRTGGVSLAPYDSLNLGAHVGDVDDSVRENRRRVRERLGLPAEPVWLQQVHGIEVEDLDVRQPGVPQPGAVASGREGPSGGSSVSPRAEPPRAESAVALTSVPMRADAAVTRLPGRVCVIQVADCMPVLFAARDGSAIGAAHAGWRGLAGGVLEETVRKLAVPPRQLIAWLGPTIGQGHFEVGDDVRSAFVLRDPNAASAFETNVRGRWQCDLYALARRRLSALGVQDVFGGGWCTYADAERFFSFRRDGQCGRMAALVWME
ncbi:MAG TPA: peptidoglycan editing factor PgeF [Steroidobacteraceae bacterium]|nr:peptidoglycan editing factor PgeF [Steroidobacteraceae bacterium]